MIRLKHIAFVLLISIWKAATQTVNEMNEEYGVYLGEFTGPNVQGKVHVVNETTIQILNFTYNDPSRGMLIFYKVFEYKSINL